MTQATHDLDAVVAQALAWRAAERKRKRRAAVWMPSEQPWFPPSIV